MDIRDYNGTGQWSAAAVLDRYRDYCLELGLTPTGKLTLREHIEKNVRWIFPVMDSVIEGIESGDRACIALGVDFIEEDQRFPFGRILKANAARALRRVQLDAKQTARVRRRVVEMLVCGNVPREFKQYAKLFRHVGVGDCWPEIERRVPRENRYVMRWFSYLRESFSMTP
jgi:hypothetical protein